MLIIIIYMGQDTYNEKGSMWQNQNKKWTWTLNMNMNVCDHDDQTMCIAS